MGIWLRGRLGVVALLAGGAVAVAIAGNPVGASGSLPASVTTTSALAYVGDSATAHPRALIAAANGSHARALGPATTVLLSPNGRWVAATLSTSGAPDSDTLAVTLYSTGTGRPLVRTVVRASRDPTLLAWSADSQLLAIGEFDQLVVVNIATGHTQLIARGQIGAASFAPNLGDRLAFDRARPNASAVNVYVARADGRDMRALTTDGRSHNPLWGPLGILFTRDTSRGSSGPLYELWRMSATGGDARQLTQVPASPPSDGLIPIALSVDGRHLLAAFSGAGTDEAWTVDLSSLVPVARDLTGSANGTIPVGISRDGRTILAERGSASTDGAHLAIEVLPWAGGAASVLVAHGASPSWNR